MSSEVLGPECEPRVRSSIVSQHRCAHELIRDSERRSDLLLHWHCSRVVNGLCRLEFGGSQLGVAAEQCPDDARVLGGDGHAGAVIAATFTHGQRPTREPVLASLGGLQDGARAEDQQGSQVRIAASGDVAEASLAAGRVLPWHEAEPGGELPPIGELVGIADTSDESRGAERPDTVEDLHAPRALVAAAHADEVALVIDQVLIEESGVGQQIGQHPRDWHGQLLEQHRHAPTDLDGALRQDVAELGEQAADSVERRGALRDEALAYAMQRVIFRRNGATKFSAYRSQAVFGIKEPLPG